MPENNKVLVIDDEEDICRTLVSWLNGHGYTASYYISAPEGLEVFKVEKFPVVLLDIKMPETDGITVLKTIKALNPATLVILMTGFPSDETITQALGLGAYDYMVKPFPLEKMQFLVERAFSYYNILVNTKKRKE